MSESNTASVECPLCGEAFDPAAAGGWCTNSDCGEWQHDIGAPSDGETEADEREGGSIDDADRDATDSAFPDGNLDDQAESETPSDDQSPEEGTTDSDTAEPVDATSAADTADDATPETSDDSSGVEGGTDDGTADDGPASDDAVDERTDETTVDCPGCGSSLSADLNFCPDCGEDVGDLPADSDDELDACPSCDADVGPDDSFCVECGENLESHRGDHELTECPDCGADVDSDDSFCAGCGTDLDAHRSGDVESAGVQSDGATESSAPDALALAAHGRSVVVEDGDAVGREIRSLLTDAGRPEDEAVRIHREHVRFVRESGRFHVVALGTNPTRVNGTSVARDDRKAIAPGDELELSDVVTLSVEAA